MLLKMSALPVPGPCASRMMVPSSMFQSTSASISASSPCALSASIQPRKSPKATGLRSTDRSSGRAWSITDADLTVVPAKAGTHDHRLWNMGPRFRGDDGQFGAEPIGVWRYTVCDLAVLRVARDLALARGDLDRVDDLGIGGAAAEIAGEIVPDLIFVRVGMRLEQLRRHQHEARRA